MRLRSPGVWLAALPAIALLVWFASSHHYVCPKGEQWGLVPIVDRFLGGELSFRDLWVQKNAHRIFFPKLILLATVAIGDWNPLHEALTVCALGVVALAGVLYALLPVLRFERRWIVSLVVFVTSAFCLSLSQFENWIWGMQVTLLLSFAATIWGLALLARGATAPRLAASVALGIVATFSLSLGLAYWPIGFLILLLAPRDAEPATRPWVPACVWAGVSLFAGWAFFYRFRRGSRAGEGLDDLSHTGKYLLTYLGNPVAVDTDWAMGLAVVGLAAVVALVAWHWRRTSPRSDWVLAAALCVHPLITGALIGSGRAHFSLQQALSSRYITFASLLWLGALGLWAAYLVRRDRPARVADGLAAFLIATTLVGAYVRATRGYEQGVAVTQRVELARDKVLETYPNVPPQVIAVLNFNHPEETLKEYLPILKRQRLSLFRHLPDPDTERKGKRRRKKRDQK